VPHRLGGFSGIGPLNGGFVENINTGYIKAYNDKESIEFYLENVLKAGEYSLNFTTTAWPDNLNPQNYGLYIKDDDNANSSFIITSAYTRKVTILKLDTLNKVISGTFEFTGVNNQNKTIKITDGRFDVKTHEMFFTNVI